MVAGAGGAPAVRIRTPLGAPRRISSAACASPIRTVGAAHRILADSRFIKEKTFLGSTRRRQICAPPTAVTVHTKVQPLARNMGSVQRERSAEVIGTWIRLPTTLRYAFRCVIMTPLGRDVVPLV